MADIRSAMLWKPVLEFLILISYLKWNNVSIQYADLWYVCLFLKSTDRKLFLKSLNLYLKTKENNQFTIYMTLTCEILFQISESENCTYSNGQKR